MRIVFLNTLYAPHPNTGGAEATLRFLARQLADRGHDCAIVTLTPERRGWSGEVDGLPVHYLPLANVYWPHGGRRPRPLRPVFQLLDARNPVMRRRLRRKLAELRPDVVHAHNLQGFSVSAWEAAERLGVPVVQTLHDYYVACPRSTMWRPDRGNCATPCRDCRAFAGPRRRLSALPAIVTSVSDRVLARVRAAGVFAGTEARIIRGNNTGGPLSGPGSPAADGRGDGGAGGKLRLGFIGRLDPVKGVERLLAAVATLPADRVSLRVAGHGAEDYVAGLRAAVPPGTDIRFVGHVAPDDFFAATDLLVIPSLWEDPFPRVFHEALRHGVPSLTVPLGGIPEAIVPGENGFVAAGADQEGLRQALAGLLERGWDRDAVRAACLASAADYAPDRIVSEYEDALLAAAGRGTARPARPA